MTKEKMEQMVDDFTDHVSGRGVACVVVWLNQDETKINILSVVDSTAEIVGLLELAKAEVTAASLAS